MAVHFYNFKPDTCECVICQRWDDNDGDFTENHTYVESYTVDNPESNNHNKTFATIRCNAHKGISDINDLQDTIYKDSASEQKRKNFMYTKFLENHPIIAGQEGFHFPVSFSGTGGGRLLGIVFPEGILTDLEKTTLQVYANASFGTGKVEVK